MSDRLCNHCREIIENHKFLGYNTQAIPSWAHCHHELEEKGIPIHDCSYNWVECLGDGGKICKICGKKAGKPKCWCDTPPDDRWPPNCAAWGKDSSSHIVFCPVCGKKLT